VAKWSPIYVQNYKYDDEYNGLTGLFSVIVLNDS